MKCVNMRDVMSGNMRGMHPVNMSVPGVAHLVRMAASRSASAQDERSGEDCDFGDLIFHCVAPSREGSLSARHKDAF